MGKKQQNSHWTFSILMVFRTRKIDVGTSFDEEGGRNRESSHMRQKPGRCITGQAWRLPDLTAITTPFVDYSYLYTGFKGPKSINKLNLAQGESKSRSPEARWET
jgi:hypothetical protein